MGGFAAFEDLGAIITWVFKGFKGAFKQCQEGFLAFYVGVFVVLLFIVLLFNI